jgi:trans-aconitate methyltransferase
VVTGESLFDSYHLRGQLGFDLIYSRITLQHMPTAYQHEYLAQFVRLLHPDGVAVFQIPDGPEYHHENEWLSMYGVPRAEVEDWVGDVGGDLLDVQQLEEPDSQWVAYRYTMRARGSR